MLSMHLTLKETAVRIYTIEDFDSPQEYMDYIFYNDLIEEFLEQVADYVGLSLEEVVYMIAEDPEDKEEITRLVEEEHARRARKKNKAPVINAPVTTTIENMYYFMLSGEKKLPKQLKVKRRL